MKHFEENLQKLEQLTAEIKQSDISLEQALKDFEEGIRLAKSMEKELDAIEGRVQVLMNAPDDEAAPDAESAAAEAKPKKPRAKKPADEGPVLELFTGSSEVNGTRNS